MQSAAESKLEIPKLGQLTVVARASVLGIPIACLQIPDVIRIMQEWIDEKSTGHYLLFAGMHGVMEARKSKPMRTALEQATLVLPDGMPLVWLSRAKGHKNMLRRVYGPELMTTFCAHTGSKYRHFLYGGMEGIADKLAISLQSRYGTNTVKSITPPFHELSEMELMNLARLINETRADVVWIGISTPKQDLLIHRLRPLVDTPILLAVGAAFDFNSASKKMAPAWMREAGFEWLYRLASEPRRLWRRYLLLGPLFIVLAIIELVKEKYFVSTNGVDKR